MLIKKKELCETKSNILNRSKVLHLLILIVSISLLHSSCARKTDFSVYRFIDHLTENNILLSPFNDMAKDPKGFKRMNPVLYDIADKYPLMDLGTGKNPLLLKKKMKIGPVDINTLMAPPNSHYKFPVRISANSILEFTYGIRRDDELFKRGEGLCGGQMGKI